MKPQQAHFHARLSAFVLGVCSIFAYAPFALSAALPPCRPDTTLTAFMDDPVARAKGEAWAVKTCEAENAVFSVWEPKLTALDNASEQLSDAQKRQDWQAFRSAWSEVTPKLKEMESAAIANRQSPGAANLVSLFGPDIKYFTQNAGLGLSGDLDSAAAKIIAALDVEGDKRNQAADAARNIVRQAAMRGDEFVRGLGVLAKGVTLKAQKAEQEAQAATRRDQIIGASPEAYVSGFSTRFQLFSGIVLEWTVILTIIAAIYAVKKKRLKIILKMPIIAFSVLVPTWLLNVFMPWLSEWVLIFLALVAGVSLWRFTETLPDPLARVFYTQFPGKKPPTLADTLKSILFAFSYSKKDMGVTDNPSPYVPAPVVGTHGSARWGTPREMQQAGHLVQPGQEKGFALGRAIGPAAEGVDMRFRYVGHVVTIAPTGAGKGIGAVIPTLLVYPGSALVIDVKGENAAVTARARMQMGQAVFIVDPFGVTGFKSHSFNLLDRLNPADPECVSESAILADCFVISDPKGGSGGEHFDESAKTLLQGLMLYVAGLEPARRTLGELRRLLTADEKAFVGTLVEMALDDSIAFGLPARAANTVVGMGEKERGSVLSTARRHTAFLDDPRIAGVLSRSDFDLANIKTEAMTVYLVLPANKIGPNARFVRGFVGAAIAALTSSHVQPAHRVAFLLDEFGQLGYMKVIEDAVSLLRGYGMSFWVFIQDLSQLKGVYPKWQTFLANSCKTFFGVDDYDTAKYVSDSLGQTTIEYQTRSEGENSGSSGAFLAGKSYSAGESAGKSQQLTGRSLLTPDEVMRLGPEKPIVITKGEYPYQLRRLNYLTDKEYFGLYDQNPYHIK
jgi:type IV secretory pathway TraG/TraD family ATPase VirD4